MPSHQSINTECKTAPIERDAPRAANGRNHDVNLKRKFTEVELWLLEALFTQGRMTAEQARGALPRRVQMLYETALAALRKLESRGLARSEFLGGALVFSPVMD